MRIDENEGVSASSKHLVFAYYVTGHGFGHATRVVEVLFSLSLSLSLWIVLVYSSIVSSIVANFVEFQVVRHLIAAGHDVHVVTGAPDFVFTSEIESPRLKIRKVCCRSFTLAYWET